MKELYLTIQYSSILEYASGGLVMFYATDYTLAFTLKITLCLMFLIVIRGCVPRYRYDFLTKMGWVKFLGYVLMLFLVSVFLFLIW